MKAQTKWNVQAGGRPIGQINEEKGWSERQAPKYYTWYALHRIRKLKVLEQLREAETPESRESQIQRRNESQRGEESLQLAWAVERGTGSLREVESREKEAKGMVKLKILGIWVVLFVLIYNCFVVNLLDQICNLSSWFLVYLEDNNVIFGQ